MTDCRYIEVNFSSIDFNCSVVSGLFKKSRVFFTSLYFAISLWLVEEVKNTILIPLVISLDSLLNSSANPNPSVTGMFTSRNIIEGKREFGKSLIHSKFLKNSIALFELE
jgi:hypothetical protein